MEITNAEFVISNTDVKKCPAGTFPEYAFIGRSNVGKSSLINMLTGRKGLAMTSATDPPALCSQARAGDFCASGGDALAV